MIDDYTSFLRQKQAAVIPAGFQDLPELNPALMPHQRQLVEYALRMGRSAGFVDTGLGKSFVELEIGRVVSEQLSKPSLLVTPLAVGAQMKREGERFGISATIAREQGDVRSGVNITNYERLERFRPDEFGAVLLDESSILKSCGSKTLWRLIEMFSATRFRYAGTATPAPNDHTELGNHAHFLGVMRMQEMLMRWFLHDSGRTQDWRLKRHAVRPFWNWVASWSRCLVTPSDFGFSDDGYVLPPLSWHRHTVSSDPLDGRGEFLFRMPSVSATEIHAEKRRTVDMRAAKAAELVASEPGEAWVVWCDTDYEQDALVRAIRATSQDFAEVRGSMKLEEKESRLIAFSDRTTRVLITKPSIAGFGLNWQHCARQCFAGISYSYEKLYQAVRRSWRFGQSRPVEIHCVLADTEDALWRTLQEKQLSHEIMKREMSAAMRRAQAETATVREVLNLNHSGRRPAFL